MRSLRSATCIALAAGFAVVTTALPLAAGSRVESPVVKTPAPTYQEAQYGGGYGHKRRKHYHSHWHWKYGHKRWHSHSHWSGHHH